MTPGSRPGEAARAGDKKGESVDWGSLWEPGGLPWFHADPAPWLCVKSECSLLLCESELSVDQCITGPWRGRRVRYGTSVLCGSAWWLCEPPLVRPAPQGTTLHGALPVTCCCLAAGVTRHRDPEQGDPAPGPGSPAAPCRGGVGTEGFRCGDGSESSRIMRKVRFTSTVGGGHTAVTTPSWRIALSVRHPWSKYLLGDSGPGGSPSFSS